MKKAKLEPPHLRIVLFRRELTANGSLDICRGCGSKLQLDDGFLTNHAKTCRHQRALEAARSLYVIALEAIPGTNTVASSASLDKHINESVADLVCALLGPCDDLHIDNNDYMRCDMAPNHGGNHSGLSRNGDRVYWVPLVARRR